MLSKFEGKPWCLGSANFGGVCFYKKERAASVTAKDLLPQNQT